MQSCKAGATCPQLDPDSLFGNFQAVLGISTRTPDLKGIASPMASLAASGQYMISLAPVGTPSGSLVLDPDAGTIARFTNLFTLPAGPNGGFKDQVVPFCLNSFCGGKPECFWPFQPNAVMIATVTAM